MSLCASRKQILLELHITWLLQSTVLHLKSLYGLCLSYPVQYDYRNKSLYFGDRVGPRPHSKTRL